MIFHGLSSSTQGTRQLGTIKDGCRKDAEGPWRIIFGSQYFKIWAILVKSQEVPKNRCGFRRPGSEQKRLCFFGDRFSTSRSIFFWYTLIRSQMSGSLLFCVCFFFILKVFEDPLQISRKSMDELYSCWLSSWCLSFSSMIAPWPTFSKFWVIT